MDKDSVLEAIQILDEDSEVHYENPQNRQDNCMGES